MFSYLTKVIGWLFKKPPHEKSNSSNTTSSTLIEKSQIYYFNTIIERDITPSNDLINEAEFIVVIYKKKPIWALFKCPCGCGYVITLPLQKPHNPRWSIHKSEFGRPTLYPSIWQNKGCYSHFWVEDGKVIWCKNTGIEPWLDDD
jgi:hypothetical protein